MTKKNVILFDDNDNEDLITKTEKNALFYENNLQCCGNCGRSRYANAHCQILCYAHNRPRVPSSYCGDWVNDGLTLQQRVTIKIEPEKIETVESN
jgi:hypothetical protein